MQLTQPGPSLLKKEIGIYDADDNDDDATTDDADADIVNDLISAEKLLLSPQSVPASVCDNNYFKTFFLDFVSV